ncbi:signal-regulatory protein beta-2-like [Betta splendens]|uniref:Signal-regulatory protein beta-2-like n=1 Tax=Betta splendens TaxID=158456 RepID=A0A9W2Y373_BETSP|nr:signal-regulatory protein beta-2-like [Betta splendens]
MRLAGSSCIVVAPRRLLYSLMHQQLSQQHTVRMMVLWVVLLVLHQGHALTPVVSVRPGEPVTLSCSLTKTLMTNREVQWYRNNAGETLKLIVKLQKSSKPEYSGEISESRLMINEGDDFINVTILRTTFQDEGMYHCEVRTWLEKPVWTGTNVLVKGHSERTSALSVVQTSSVSDPVRPDSVTLQCSVLSASDNKTCPGGPSVYWFRAGSDQSPPGIISTDGNSECEQRSDSVKSCVYRFSKTISSSDAGTYRCAVATCGQILFGEGTKIQSGKKVNHEFISLGMLTVCLALSLTANIVFICYRKSMCQQFKGNDTQARHDNSSHLLRDGAEGEQDLNYAALHISGGKATRGKKKKDLNTEESVYTQVKC